MQSKHPHNFVSRPHYKTQCARHVFSATGQTVQHVEFEVGTQNTTSRMGGLERNVHVPSGAQRACDLEAWQENCHIRYMCVPRGEGEDTKNM